MKKLLLAGAGLLVMTTGAVSTTTTPAAAEVVYPWCSVLDGDVRNCGFATFNQCAANLGTQSGVCVPNQRHIDMRGYASAHGPYGYAYAPSALGGAAVGAGVGAAVGGPVGAVVGAGIGAAATR
jgi:hypothetical protein